MKKSILFVLLFASSFAAAQLPYLPLLNTNANGTSTSTITCAYPRNVTAGNIGVLFLAYSTNTITNVTDTLSSLWSPAITNTSFAERIAVYTTTFASSGANTVTFTTSGTFAAIICNELDPKSMSTTVDVSSVTNWTSSTSTIQAPNVTTTNNGDLVFTFFANDNGNKPYYLDPSTSLQRANPTGSYFSGDGVAGYYSFGGAPGTFTGITVQNPNSEAVGTRVTVAFKPPAIAIQAPSALPDGVVSTVYNYKLPATGGTGAYTWSITSGSLPTGLSLNTSTGAITGTVGAAASNNYSLTFQVTDGTNTTTKAVTLKIGASAVNPTFVQGIGNASAGNTSLTLTVTAGHLLVAHDGGNLTTGFAYCNDTLNTPFKILANAQTSISVGGGQATIYAGVAPSSGSDTVTCGRVSQFSEYSNVSAADLSNALYAVAASGTALSTGSMTTLVPNELLLMSCATQTTGDALTVNSPFTQTESTVTSTYKMGYQVASTVTGYTGTCTAATSSFWQATQVGIRPAAGAVVVSSVGQPWPIVVN